MNPTPRLFLLFRFGIPLACVAVAYLFIVIHPTWVGWLSFPLLALVEEMGVTLFTEWQVCKRWNGYWLRALRPLFKLLRLEDRWLLSFCAWNNLKVSRAFKAKKATKALVLLPHCIQATRCKLSIREDIQSCQKCGKCRVADLAIATKQHNWNVCISPRSHLAYKEVRKYNPDLIIAVACPDRLVKGLLRVPEIPSYTIPLELPHGMCVDTTFDFRELSGAVERLGEA